MFIGVFLDTSAPKTYISTRLRGVLRKPQQSTLSNFAGGKLKNGCQHYAAPRPGIGPAARRERKRKGGHHHPRLSKRETARGRGNRRRSGKNQRGRQANRARCEGGRSHPVREV